MFITKLQLVLVAAFLFHACIEAATTWRLSLVKENPDPDFYGLSHWSLELMLDTKPPSNGYIMQVLINENGISYRKDIKGPGIDGDTNGYNQQTRGTRSLLKARLSDADRAKILTAFNDQPAPNPTANPHRNCQHFIQSVITASGISLPCNRGTLCDPEAPDTLPDNSDPTTAYTARTNNFQTFRTTGQAPRWTFAGAVNTSPESSAGSPSPPPTRRSRIMRRTPPEQNQQKKQKQQKQPKQPKQPKQQKQQKQQQQPSGGKKGGKGGKKGNLKDVDVPFENEGIKSTKPLPKDFVPWVPKGKGGAKKGANTPKAKQNQPSGKKARKGGSRKR